jgi:hypothetical protein
MGGGWMELRCRRETGDERVLVVERARTKYLGCKPAFGRLWDSRPEMEVKMVAKVHAKMAD